MFCRVLFEVNGQPQADTSMLPFKISNWIVSVNAYR
jgi:hypothetical protein